MIKKTEFFPFFLVLTILLCTWPGIGICQNTYELISTAQLEQVISQKEDVCLVNVLPKILHDAKHIEGSINIPLGQMDSGDKLPKDKHKPLIFYCMGTL